jgi:chromosome segregation ATPase
MGFGLATTSGAVLTAVGTGDLQELVRSLSGEPAADPVADQLLQTATIARLENDVRTMIDEISDLKAQRQAVQQDPAITEHFARLDADLAQLRNETRQLSTDTGQLKTLTAQLGTETDQLKSVITQLRIEAGELRASLDEVATARPGRDQIENVQSRLAQANANIDAMRSSLDASDHTHRKEVVEIGRRVDRLEHSVAAAEVTGAIGANPHRRGFIGVRRARSHRLVGSDHGRWGGHDQRPNRDL